MHVIVAILFALVIAPQSVLAQERTPREKAAQGFATKSSSAEEIAARDEAWRKRDEAAALALDQKIRKSGRGICSRC